LKEIINRILKFNDLIEMLDTLPKEEREQFVFDLKSLKHAGIKFDALGDY
jgi:hypothetical protein